jgi:tRNA (guanine37-N1)-methyltransferase
MIFHVLTIFPDFFRGPFEHGIVAKARESGAVEIRVHNLRDWTYDRHKTVDDRPFGGGEGMLLKPEPIFLAVESIWPERQPGRKVILLSASGRLFDQGVAERLSQERELLFICGRYEGVDERVASYLANEEYSIGSFVLSGGELAAAVMIDSIARLLPGVLGNEDSTVWESFASQGHGPALVDCPQYTRPAEFRGIRIPDVLLSGHHEQIRSWRRKAAEEKTARMRPDLLERRAGNGPAEREGNRHAERVVNESTE